MAKCDQCQQVRVNGLVTHELGCPNSWKDDRRKCKNCGKDFKPKEKHQTTCSMRCQKEYWG